MKYLNEFRDPKLAQKLFDDINRITTQKWAIMEVCGGQTHSIIKNGLDQLRPEAGLAKVEAARVAGRWNADPRPGVSEDMPREFAAALEGNRQAREFFEGLTRTQRKQFILWINVAKKPATRQHRIAESVRLLERGRKLGMV